MDEHRVHSITLVSFRKLHVKNQKLSDVVIEHIYYNFSHSIDEKLYRDNNNNQLLIS